MKSAADQEAVTNKVLETFELYRSLADVPVMTDTSAPVRASVTVASDEEVDYVRALYELFVHAHDANLAGRVNGNMLVAN